MNSLPNYGPWDKYVPVRKLSDSEKKAVDDMLRKETKGLIKKWEHTGLLDGLSEDTDKSHMAVLCYSPPFPPMDENLRKIWDALLSMGIVEIQMVEKDGQLGVVPYVNQTLTLVSGKFYPIVPYGGEEQQKAIVPHLKDA